MLAADAVLESRAFTEMEALNATPPLIDFTASNLDELLRKPDGRTVRRFDGRSTVVHTQDAETRRVDMTRRQRFLSALDAQRFDALLCPPYALPAPTHGISGNLNVTNAGSYAILYNLLGLPAGVAPVER